MLCVEMPIHQGAKQVTRADRHIDWLMEHYPNVKREPVDLTPIFDSLVNAVPKQDDEENKYFSLVHSINYGLGNTANLCTKKTNKR